MPTKLQVKAIINILGIELAGRFLITNYGMSYKEVRDLIDLVLE